MSVLTVRVSNKEKASLARRAKAAGKTTGAYVRDLINTAQFITAADLVAEMEGMMGDKSLRVKPRE